MNSLKMMLGVLTGAFCLAALPMMAMAEPEEAENFAENTGDVPGGHSAEAEILDSVAEIPDGADEIPVDGDHFPDAAFRKYVEQCIDVDGDDVLCSSEIEAVERIDIAGVDAPVLCSLAGIEYFPYLEELDCCDNVLTELDMSQNLRLRVLLCSGNFLEELDVSRNTALEELNCYENDLKELELNKNTALKKLNCSWNQISELDVSHNGELSEIYCDNNDMSRLEVGSLPVLKVLCCNDNSLSGLDLGTCPSLTELCADNNSLSGLDLSTCLSLTRLSADNNSLKSLDVSANKKLTDLHLCGNSIRSMELGSIRSLRYIYADGNRLVTLALNRLLSLRELSLRNNTTLTELDVTNNQKLEKLFCDGTAVKVLDLRENTTLAYLSLPSGLAIFTAPVVKITSSGGKPKLTWNSVDGALRYTIRRSEDGHNYRTYKTVTGTSFTDTDAVIGIKYYYKIRVSSTVIPEDRFSLTDTDEYGAESGGAGVSADQIPYSKVKSITCVPTAPVIRVTRSAGKPKISWQAVPGAMKYRVYRSCDGGRTYSYLSTTTGLSFTHSRAMSGTRYYYKVKAVRTLVHTDYESAFSSRKSLLTTLKAPHVSITRCDGHPKLSWAAVKGADRYYIYRSTDGRTFTKLTSTTKTYYVNTKAAAGKTCYYKVKAVSDSVSSANSAYSAKVSIKAK